MNLFYQPLISEGVHYLDETESRHLIKVLRKKSGDAIDITDGNGYLYHALIKDADSRQCTFHITERTSRSEKTFQIHIAISPLKNPERLEWFVEKCIEFGIDKITLLDCDHTEKHFFKPERLHKISVSAMKQSLALKLPQLRGPIPFHDFMDEASGEKFIAHVDHTNKVQLINAVHPNQSYLVLIGPEGDFSGDEISLAIKHGFTKVSLGPTRLRTETAGVAACHILNLVNTPGRHTFE